MDRHAEQNHGPHHHHHGHHNIETTTTSSSFERSHHHHHHNHHHHLHPLNAGTAGDSAQGDSWLTTTVGPGPHSHHGFHDNNVLTNDADDHAHQFHPSGSDLHHASTHGHGSSMHGGMGMEMGHAQPFFKWVTNGPVLFQQWTTSTALELSLAMLTAAFLAGLYELLRNWLSTWDNTKHSLSEMPRWKRVYLRSCRSILHALNAGVGYLQMLFAMTYDLRIFIAILLGSGLGFFVLGPYFRRRILKRRADSRPAGEGGEEAERAEGEGRVGREHTPSEDKAGMVEESDLLLEEDRETVL